MYNNWTIMYNSWTMNYYTFLLWTIIHILFYTDLKIRACGWQDQPMREEPLASWTTQSHIGKPLRQHGLLQDVTNVRYPPRNADHFSHHAPLVYDQWSFETLTEIRTICWKSLASSFACDFAALGKDIFAKLGKFSTTALQSNCCCPFHRPSSAFT